MTPTQLRAFAAVVRLGSVKKAAVDLEVSEAAVSLNIGQLPASLILLACAGRLAGHAWPYVACGLLSLVGVIGILSGTGWVIVAAAAALGFSGAATLTLLLAL